MLRNFLTTTSHRSVRLLSSVIRGDYNQVSDDDVQVFSNILQEASMVLTEEDELKAYNEDWMGIYHGKSRLVLRPKTTNQVSDILKHCNQRRLAVVPQGGNTGLVGGSVPLFDEVILSTQLMNQLISFEPNSGVLKCQAGCVLESLNEYVKKHQFMLPLDLGAKGSCHIGGNVSTNAGGIRLLRYGSLQGSVLGVEAVTGEGTVVDLMSGMRKDNSGYHLKHLFIGSEGTLGIVTQVSILCASLPSSVNLAICGCESFDQVLYLLSTAKKHLGEILSAFEMMDAVSLRYAEAHLHTSLPIGPSNFYVLFETSGSVEEHDQSKLTKFFEEVQDVVIDGTLALDNTKIQNLWKFRETVPVGLNENGCIYKYDVSLPLAKYYEVVEMMRGVLGDDVIDVCGYGHVGDGNIHFTVVADKHSEELKERIDRHLYSFVVEHEGSISAEHGVGVGKRDHLHLARSKESIELMRSVKDLLDPKHILNPYKVLAKPTFNSISPILHL